MNEFTNNITRRTFLKTTAAGVATFAIGRSGFAANEKLQHACIGVGGMGWGDLHTFKSHPKLQIVALCDVDKNHLAKAAALFPEARQYTDWRELLAKEGSRVDSVNVSTPDHMHAPIVMTALRARKHVYCQKPLCHDVAECRALARAAKSAGVTTQLGTQHASGIGDRMAVEWLREGVVGKVNRVILCSNRPNAIQMYRLPGPRPAEGQPPPANLEWDLWLGTAPTRPYAPEIYHPTKWRAWQDFGTGWSGDIGCHIFSAVWLGLGLTAPLSVVADVQASWKDSPPRRADTWPQGQHITWTFPNNLVVEWFDGAMYPPADVRKLAEIEKYPEESAMVIGSEGVLVLQHGTGPRLFPTEKFKDLPRPKPAPRNHYHYYVDACHGGPKTESNFLVTGPMTEAILLGTVAVRTPGTLLKWNASSLSITNHREAGQYLRRTYRKGWEVRGL